jgi:hypothetical protein
MDSNRLVPLGYVQLTSTIASSAASLTVPTGTTHLLMQAETQAVRWRDDGVSPTASVGMLLPVGVPAPYSGTPSIIQFIAAASGAVLDISFYKWAG